LQNGPDLLAERPVPQRGTGRSASHVLWMGVWLSGFPALASESGKDGKYSLGESHGRMCAPDGKEAKAKKWRREIWQ